MQKAMSVLATLPYSTMGQMADKGVACTNRIRAVARRLWKVRGRKGYTELMWGGFMAVCMLAAVLIPFANANARIRGRVVFGMSPYFYYPYTYPSPYYYPYYRYYPYPAPYYYAAPPDVSPQQPAVPAEPAPAYWYFCPSKNAYYPYVRSCPEAWRAVPAAPALPPTSSPTTEPPK